MKKIIRKTMGLGVMAILILGYGCIVTDNSSQDSNCVSCGGGPAVQEVWQQCALPADNTLMVGLNCGACGAGGDCCTYGDTDYSPDSLEFSGADYNLVDLQLSFTLTNYSNLQPPVWIDLCDDIGCENLIEIQLYPYETYGDRLPNPVLDSAMEQFDQCISIYGDGCWMLYYVDVWLGEDCVCSPVELDYHYEGLYVY